MIIFHNYFSETKMGKELVPLTLELLYEKCFEDNENKLLKVYSFQTFGLKDEDGDTPSNSDHKPNSIFSLETYFCVNGDRRVR